MGILEVINSPVTMAIMLICLIVFITFMTNRKISEQNHKITSMVGLVSTLAEEVNHLKRVLSTGAPSYNPNNVFPVNHGGSGIDINLQSENNDLIDVSDGDDSDDYEDDDDDEEDDDEEDDDDDDDEDDDDEDDDDDDDDEDVENNVIDILESNITLEKIPDINDIDENDETFPDLDESSNTESKIIILDEPLDVREEDKSVDYKKMSITSLKELAIKKGLIEPESKIAKKALLKILVEE